MKIVHLTPAFFPHLGGVETHVKKISQELLLLGNEVSVLTLQTDSSSPSSKVIAGVNVRRCNLDSVDVRSFRYKFKIWSWFWQQRSVWLEADVVQVHDVFWWILPFLVLIHHKVFTTFHGWETRYPVRWSAKFQRYCWSLFSVATIHVGAWIQEFYWDKPTLITCGGADVTQEKIEPRPLKSLRKIVFLGRLSPENEVEKYLELFRFLKKKFPQLEITWVGDGPLRNTCAAVGKVTGMVENPEKYLRTADFVGASSYLSLFLAQSVGKVCLSFYSHNLKKRYLETFPSSEALVIETTSSKMVERISKLVKEQNEYLRLSTLANQSARNNSWKTVTQIYLLLWKQAGIL